MIDVSSFRKRQWVVLGMIGAFFLGSGVLYVLVSSQGSSAAKRSPLYKNSLTTAARRMNPQEAWVYKFSREAELTQKRLNTMDEMLTKLLKLHESASTKEIQQSTQEPSAALETLRNDLKTHQTPSLSSGTPSDILPLPPGSLDGTPIEGSEGRKEVLEPFRSKALRKVSFTLKNKRNQIFLKTNNNTIPAGTFAQAILLGGVDASASIQAASDPRPALLRLTHPGTLPRQFQSDLKGCHVLAACYGDISSERVMMRLEKLTCTERQTGEIIEMKVQGYVAGEDGRTGVRGVVVDRAGESMRHAMVGGFIGGLGDFLSQSRNAVTFSPLSGFAQTNPLGAPEMIKYGAGKGISNALDKYADFYIKRAEQVQPVIQVAAGRHVDIVFTEGVSIGDSAYRQATSRSHDQERYQKIQTLSEPSQKSLTDWTRPQSKGMN